MSDNYQPDNPHDAPPEGTMTTSSQPYTPYYCPLCGQYHPLGGTACPAFWPVKNDTDRLQQLESENARLRSELLSWDVLTHTLTKDEGDMPPQLTLHQFVLDLQSQLSASRAESENRMGVIKADCENETLIEEMVKPYLTEFEIHGDSNGVPGSVGIVETLCKKLEVSRKDTERLDKCQSIVEDSDNLLEFGEGYLSHNIRMRITSRFAESPKVSNGLTIREAIDAATKGVGE